MNDTIVPTFEQVMKADHEQLCRWWRFIPAGAAKLDGPHVMDLISERMFKIGGFTPEISKKIGWKPNLN